jgi:hypothetical protein
MLDLINHKEERHPPDLMRPIGETEFVVVTEGENKGSRVDFIPGANERPRYLRIGGRLFDWTREAGAEPGRADERSAS